MKVNEAPEKIYVDSNAIGDNISTTVDTKRQDYPTCTEYIRTDAFIEKVCNLLTIMVWEVTYEDLEGDSVEHYDKTEFIEEIRKYLESKV